MQVCVIHQARDLRIEDRAVPDLPPGGALIRVRAGGICGSDLRGAMRFDREFAHAVACLDRGLIDVAPLLTACVPAGQAAAAFDLAKQRDQHSEVQTAF